MDNDLQPVVAVPITAATNNNNPEDPPITVDNQQPPQDQRNDLDDDGDEIIVGGSNTREAESESKLADQESETATVPSTETASGSAAQSTTAMTDELKSYLQQSEQKTLAMIIAQLQQESRANLAQSEQRAAQLEQKTLAMMAQLQQESRAGLQEILGRYEARAIERETRQSSEHAADIRLLKLEDQQRTMSEAEAEKLRASKCKSDATTIAQDATQQPDLATDLQLETIYADESPSMLSSVFVENPMSDAVEHQQDADISNVAAVADITETESLIASKVKAVLFSTVLLPDDVFSTDLCIFQQSSDERFTSSFTRIFAEMHETVDAIQPCFDATSVILVDHINAEHFTVVSSSTMWDPGGRYRLSCNLCDSGSEDDDDNDDWATDRREKDTSLSCFYLANKRGGRYETREREVRHIVS